MKDKRIKRITRGMLECLSVEYPLLVERYLYLKDKMSEGYETHTNPGVGTRNLYFDARSEVIDKLLDLGIAKDESK